MDQFEYFYVRSIRYLSICPRSEKEIRDYLGKKKVSSDVVERIVSKLKEQRFLDDKEFTRWWIRQRTVNKPQSYFLTKRELSQKGVDKEIVSEVFLENDDERQDELDIAKKIVDAKFSKYKNYDKKETYAKLGGLLARRGFSWNIIKRAIDDYYK